MSWATSLLAGSSSRCRSGSSSSGSGGSGSSVRSSSSGCRCGSSSGCGSWGRCRLFFFTASSQGSGSDHGGQNEGLVHVNLPIGLTKQLPEIVIAAEPQGPSKTDSSCFAQPSSILQKITRRSITSGNRQVPLTTQGWSRGNRVCCPAAHWQRFHARPSSAVDPPRTRRCRLQGQSGAKTSVGSRRRWAARAGCAPD